jgi:peptide/nickel transport system ATP-binding protein
VSTLMQAHGVTRAFTLGATFFRRGRTLHAVNGVDLTIERGDVVGIVGESGCGKSTLARMLLGLLAPTSGRITLEGRDLAALGRKAVARRVQPVFQDPYSSLNPRRGIASIVALPLEVHGIGSASGRRAKAIEMLERVGLPARYADNTPGQLSGGQRQRVAIARALVNRPSIILADEPTGNLDTATGEDIMTSFEEIWRQGNTVILVTHEADIAAHARRVVRMRDGKIESDVVNPNPVSPRRREPVAT